MPVGMTPSFVSVPCSSVATSRHGPVAAHGDHDIEPMLQRARRAGLRSLRLWATTPIVDLPALGAKGPRDLLDGLAGRPALPPPADDERARHDPSAGPVEPGSRASCSTCRSEAVDRRPVVVGHRQSGQAVVDRPKVRRGHVPPAGDLHEAILDLLGCLTGGQVHVGEVPAVARSRPCARDAPPLARGRGPGGYRTMSTPAPRKATSSLRGLVLRPSADGRDHPRRTSRPKRALAPGRREAGRSSAAAMSFATAP